MTTFATLFGFLALALGIGGLLLSTFLTLLLMPVLCSFLGCKSSDA
jgi:Cu/Ag efflux pump CusA